MPGVPSSPIRVSFGTDQGGIFTTTIPDSSPSTPANPPQEPRAPFLRIVSAARVGSHSPQPAKPLPSLILFQMHPQKLLNPLQVRRIEPGIGPERMLSSLGLEELDRHIRSLQRIGKSNRLSERHALIHRPMPHIKRRRAAMHMKLRRSILALPRHRRALTAQIIRHRGRHRLVLRRQVQRSVQNHCRLHPRLRARLRFFCRWRSVKRRPLRIERHQRSQFPTRGTARHANPRRIKSIFSGVFAEELHRSERFMERSRKMHRVHIVFDRESHVAILSQSLDQLDHLVAIAVLPAAAVDEYNWSATGLPAWLNLSTAGVLTGTPPLTATNATFTVTVTDSSNNSTSGSFTVPVTLAITTTSPLPTGQVGVNYSQTLTAIGGSGQYTWAVSAGS